jgi:4-diphosphocytidyl-2-C-methyl-D-erythritol kinase
MIAFPNCKINLGLNILRQREDGYHDLETVFLPIALNDALEILPSKNKTTLEVSGFLTGDAIDNLCIKAYHLLKKDFPQLPGINIHLHKAIPLGAGLAGGSADAVSMLQLINNKFNLNISEEQLYVYALQLGSDCPFFVYNKPCFAAGRGEMIVPINISLSDYKIALVNPGLHISTAEAFLVMKPTVPVKRIREIIGQPIETWKFDLINDFEKYAFETYPQVKEIKNQLYETGALYASMSGSGSTVFGIFKKADAIKYVANSNYFYRVIELF